MEGNMLKSRLTVVGVALLMAAVLSEAGDLGALFQEREVLKEKIDAVNKEYEPKVKPLEDQLSALRKEIKEKTQKDSDRKREIDKQIPKEFEKFLPTGKQSYGDFKWKCSGSSFLILRAEDSSGKQMIWAHAFYKPDMTPEKQKEYGNKECCGLSAKRFTDKWVWVQVGKVEIRFGLSDSSLESDATLDAIVASLDLEGIKAL